MTETATEARVSWDHWRANYDQWTTSDQNNFYDQVWDEYRDQRHAKVAPLWELIAVIDRPVQIVELGHQTDDDPLAGAKGGGEGGIVATAATIANAVADALGPAGGDVASLPIMPETVQRLALEPR